MGNLDVELNNIEALLCLSHRSAAWNMESVVAIVEADTSDIHGRTPSGCRYVDDNIVGGKRLAEIFVSCSGLMAQRF